MRLPVFGNFRKSGPPGRCVFLIAGFIAFLQLPAARADDRADKAFLDLVTQAERSPDSVDYGAMRRAYAASRYYKGYESDPMNFQAAQLLGQPEPSKDEIQRYVQENFALAGAHLVAIGKLGLKAGMPEFEMHKIAHVKLLEAIISTGKGLSKDNAIKVLVPSEEYLICSVIGAKVQSQASRTEGEASFNVLTVQKDGWPKSIELWFDISALTPR
jgi:hypothetical protein